MTRTLRRLLLILIYVVAMAFTIGVAMLPIGASWLLAAQNDEVNRRPWRMCVVAKLPVRKGMPMAAEDFDWSLRRIEFGKDAVADPALLVGRFAARDLPADSTIYPDDVLDAVPCPAGKYLCLPVEVKPEHAAGLRPGARLAFVQQGKEEGTFVTESAIKEAAPVPPTRRKGAPAEPAPQVSFELISIIRGAKPDSPVALIVAVEQKDALSAAKLGSGQWRPLRLNLSRE